MNSFFSTKWFKRHNEPKFQNIILLLTLCSFLFILSSCSDTTAGPPLPDPTTSIQYSVPVAGHVTLTILNGKGKSIATLVDQYEESGNYQVTFNATDLPSGVYFYRLQIGHSVTTRKMDFVK